MKVSPPGVEPGLRLSQSRVPPPHPEDESSQRRRWESNPLPRFCKPLPGRPAPASLKYPRQELNLAHDLRRIAFVRHTPGTISIPTWNRTRIEALGPPHVVCYTIGTPRADDWIRTSIVRLTRAVPFSVEPRRQEQERKESNLVGRFWRPLALPGAHSYRNQGVGGELNPPLRRSQRRVLHRYTTNTISHWKERESNPQGRLMGSTAFQAVPVANRVALPKVSRPGWTRTTPGIAEKT